MLECLGLYEMIRFVWDNIIRFTIMFLWDNKTQVASVQLGKTLDLDL